MSPPPRNCLRLKSVDSLAGAEIKCASSAAQEPLHWRNNHPWDHSGEGQSLQGAGGRVLARVHKRLIYLEAVSIGTGAGWWR